MCVWQSHAPPARSNARCRRLRRGRRTHPSHVTQRRRSAAAAPFQMFPRVIIMFVSSATRKGRYGSERDRIDEDGGRSVRHNLQTMSWSMSRNRGSDGFGQTRFDGHGCPPACFVPRVERAGASADDFEEPDDGEREQPIESRSPRLRPRRRSDDSLAWSRICAG